MEIADGSSQELGIEHFFNIQLVGEHVIEINPRISTIVYQEDLNLPYLGVKRALGEISDEELAALRSRIRPGRTRAALLRPDRMGRPGRRRPARTRVAERPLRVTHCPVNTAGVPWDERPGAAARGVDARLVVFKRYALHPEADGSLEPPGNSLSQPAGAAVGGARAAAAAHRRLPLLLRADARAAVAPVPDPARGAQEVGHALPRLGHPRQDAGRSSPTARRPDARDRRQLRRDPLGARGGGDPARDRPRRDRARAAVATARAR